MTNVSYMDVIGKARTVCDFCCVRATRLDACIFELFRPKLAELLYIRQDVLQQYVKVR